MTLEGHGLHADRRLGPERSGLESARGSRKGASRPAACILAVSVALALASMLQSRPASAQDSFEVSPVDVVRSYAQIFAAQQNLDGSYQITPNVQTHLKAEIGMALASDMTHQRDYLTSARRDLDWVIANRMEANGGINWNGPQTPWFFEVHQHWFLIASELIRRMQQPPQGDPLKQYQTQAWQYLLRSNSASADFYVHNWEHHGVFFGYRSIDREGHWQSQGNFKGSYEVGAALWSMALHRGDGWLTLNSGGSIDTSTSPGSYMRRMVPQIMRPLSQHGFYDPDKHLWIRSVLWNGMEWTDYETHDWKYAPHMQEGALLYTLLTGKTDLMAPARLEMEHLLSQVNPDGTIRGIPDPNGTAAYEYGTVLSCLGLGARVFWGPEPELGNRCFQKGQLVFRYASQTFPPISSEDRAILLAGFCRIMEAGRQVRDLVWGGSGEGADTVSVASSPLSLVAWPNPMRDHMQFLYSLPKSTSGELKIVDASGRHCVTMTLKPDSQGSGQVTWDGLDDECRRLPSGHYQALLQSAGHRKITGFAILK